MDDINRLSMIQWKFCMKWKTVSILKCVFYLLSWWISWIITSDYAPSIDQWMQPKNNFRTNHNNKNRYVSCFRLTHTAQWKTDFRSLAVPGFLQARLNVDGSPRDTFIQMTVNKAVGLFVWSIVPFYASLGILTVFVLRVGVKVLYSLMDRISAVTGLLVLNVSFTSLDTGSGAGRIRLHDL